MLAAYPGPWLLGLAAITHLSVNMRAHAAALHLLARPLEYPLTEANGCSGLQPKPHAPPSLLH
jgi:hypothetical protein